MNSPDLSLSSPPSLAELRAAAVAAAKVRNAAITAVDNLACEAAPNLAALATLAAVRAVAKGEIDRYLDALAEAYRKAAAPAQLPEGKAPARKPRKAKPLDA